MDRPQASSVRQDRSAERKLIHPGKVLVGIATSNEFFDLALPEPPTQLSAQGGLNDRSSAGISAGRFNPFYGKYADNAHYVTKESEIARPSAARVSIAFCRVGCSN